MTSDQKRKLQMALVGIQRRWGNNAIGLVKKRPPTVSRISTGFPALDKALGIGGIPRGCINEIIGVPTSGMATLALKIMVNAQSHQGTAVYLDLERAFDPDYADRCGVNLHQLIVVHPYNMRQALAMLPDFIANGGIDILIFDMPLGLQTESQIIQRLSTTLGRLIAPLSKTKTTLLFLTTLLPGSSPSLADYPQQVTLPHYATTRLLIQKERWLYRRRDISGYEAQVFVAKNKLSGAGKTAHILVNFDDADIVDRL